MDKVIPDKASVPYGEQRVSNQQKFVSLYLLLLKSITVPVDTVVLVPIFIHIITPEDVVGIMDFHVPLLLVFIFFGVVIVVDPEAPIRVDVPSDQSNLLPEPPAKSHLFGFAK